MICPFRKALVHHIRQLVLESTEWGQPYELVVRDGKTGFPYFNVEGQNYKYDAADRSFSFQGARLLISNEFANELRRPTDAGKVVGCYFRSRRHLRPIEVTQYLNGEVVSDVLPAITLRPDRFPGPDVIVGDLSGLAQFGSSSGNSGRPRGREPTPAILVR